MMSLYPARCVTRNYGFIGCVTGVLQQLDNLCSGRHSCKFDVSDPVLVRTKPCPQDFSSYLEASYSCIKGTVTAQWSHLSCLVTDVNCSHSAQHKKLFLSPLNPWGFKAVLHRKGHWDILDSSPLCYAEIIFAFNIMKSSAKPLLLWTFRPRFLWVGIIFFRPAVSKTWSGFLKRSVITSSIVAKEKSKSVSRGCCAEKSFNTSCLKALQKYEAHCKMALTSQEKSPFMCLPLLLNFSLQLAKTHAYQNLKKTKTTQISVKLGHTPGSLLWPNE